MPEGNVRPYSHLRPSELRVVALYAKHWNYKLVADEIGCSTQTVKNHMSNAIARCNADRAGQVVMLLFSCPPVDPGSAWHVLFARRSEIQNLIEEIRHAAAEVRPGATFYPARDNEGQWDGVGGRL